MRIEIIVGTNRKNKKLVLVGGPEIHHVTETEETFKDFQRAGKINEDYESLTLYECVKRKEIKQLSTKEEVKEKAQAAEKEHKAAEKAKALAEEKQK